MLGTNGGKLVWSRLRRHPRFRLSSSRPAGIRPAERTGASERDSRKFQAGWARNSTARCPRSREHHFAVRPPSATGCLVATPATATSPGHHSVPPPTPPHATRERRNVPWPNASFSRSVRPPAPCFWRCDRVPGNGPPGRSRPQGATLRGDSQLDGGQRTHEIHVGRACRQLHNEAGVCCARAAERAHGQRTRPAMRATGRRSSCSTATHRGSTRFATSSMVTLTGRARLQDISTRNFVDSWPMPSCSTSRAVTSAIPGRHHQPNPGDPGHDPQFDSRACVRAQRGRACGRALRTRSVAAVVVTAGASAFLRPGGGPGRTHAERGKQRRTPARWRLPDGFRRVVSCWMTCPATPSPAPQDWCWVSRT